MAARDGDDRGRRPSSGSASSISTTLAGQSTLLPGLTTSVALFEPAQVKYEKSYVVHGDVPYWGFLPQQGEETEPPVEVIYTLKRPRKTDFGDRPLPGGVARLYQPDSAGGLQLVGEASLDHTPAGNDLKLNAGTAFDITAKRVQTSYATRRDSTKARGRAHRRHGRLPGDAEERHRQRGDGRRAGGARRASGAWCPARCRRRRSRPPSPASGCGCRPRGEAVLTYRIRVDLVTSSRPVTIVHLSDLHFGGYADLKQIEALEELLPTLDATAIVVSGDLTQRARHGEFQAAHLFIHRMRTQTPALVVPGNHDIEWWKSPLGLLGERRKYAKYLQLLRRAPAGARGSRRDHRRRAEQLRRRLRLAHLEPARHGGEGPSAAVGDQPGAEDLRRRAARSGPGARGPPQRARRGHLPAAWGWPAGARPTGGCSPPAPTSSSAATTTRRAPDRSRARSRSAPRAPTASACGAAGPRCSTWSRSTRRRCTSSTSAGCPSDRQFIPSDTFSFAPQGRAQGGGLGRGWRSGAVMEREAGQRGGQRVKGLQPARDRLLALGLREVDRSRHPYQPHGDAQPQPAACFGSTGATPTRPTGCSRRSSGSSIRRVPRALRRAAEREFLALPGGGARATARAPGAARAARPGDLLLLHRLETAASRAQRRSTSAARWARSRSGSPAGCGPGWASSRSTSAPAGRSRSPSAGGTSRGTPGPRSSTRCCTRWCTSGRRRPGSGRSRRRSGRRRARWACCRQRSGRMRKQGRG